MITFAAYLCQGPSFSNKIYQRTTYPADTFKLVGSSSYSYEGSFIAVTRSRARIIDGVSTFLSVDQIQRKEAFDTWQSLHSKCMLLAAVNVAICASTIFSMLFSSYPIANGSYIAAGSFLITLLCVSRMSSAVNEAKKWMDPINHYLQLRKTCAQDFISLKNYALKNILFSSDETQNIYLNCLVQSIDNFHKVANAGDAVELERYIRVFFDRESLLSFKSIHYAFPNESIIRDPSNKNKANWSKKTLVSIAGSVEKLNLKYLQLKTMKSNKLQAVNDLHSTGHFSVLQTQRLVNSSETSQLGHLLIEAANIHFGLQRRAIERNEQDLLINEFSSAIADIFHKLEIEKLA